MKKISFKSINLKEVEQLSREQLKSVLGGFTASGGQNGVMCCPESIASGFGCSKCVAVGPSDTATCSQGYKVACTV